MVTKKKDNPPEPVPQPRGSGVTPAEPEPYTGPGAAAVVGTPVEGSYSVPDPEELAAARELDDQPGDAELEQGEPMVEYIGEFTAREISLQDWAKAGVKDQPAARWDKTNQRSIPVAGFTEHALRVLRQDGNFRIGD